MYLIITVFLFIQQCEDYTLLGQCYSLLDNRDKAINCLKKAAELNPDDEEIIKMLEEIRNNN